MATFIPHDNQSAVPDDLDTIAATDDFYPSLSLTRYRQVMRVDDTVTHERAIESIESAIMTICEDVTQWRDKQTVASLSDLSTPRSDKEKLWEKAVFHRAKALSIEKYRDIDTTNDGHAKAEAMEERIDTYLQRSREFQRLLIDKPRTTIRRI